MLHQFDRAIDDAVRVPAGDRIGILDVAVGCNQRFHLRRAPGDDVAFIVADVNARAQSTPIRSAATCSGSGWGLRCASVSPPMTTAERVRARVVQAADESAIPACW